MGLSRVLLLSLEWLKCGGSCCISGYSSRLINPPGINNRAGVAVGKIFRIEWPRWLGILKYGETEFYWLSRVFGYPGGGAGPQPVGGEEGLVLVPHSQSVSSNDKGWPARYKTLPVISCSWLQLWRLFQLTSHTFTCNQVSFASQQSYLLMYYCTIAFLNL